MHDNSISLLAVEWHILSKTTRTYFCLAFWWRELHATTLLLLKWTFCLCVFNVWTKTAGQRQAQLSHRTAATIVSMFAYICVHGSISLQMQTVWLKMRFLSGFRENWTSTTPANIQKCLECQLFMFAFDTWVSGLKDLLKQITNKSILTSGILSCL